MLENKIKETNTTNDQKPSKLDIATGYLLVPIAYLAVIYAAKAIESPKAPSEKITWSDEYRKLKEAVYALGNIRF